MAARADAAALLAGSVAPPPGLDPLTPAKVHLRQSPAQHQFPAARAAQVPAAAGLAVSEAAAPYFAPHAAPPVPASAGPEMGGWLNAVLSTAAHLDKRGLEQALEILDHAIENVQHAKAMETMIADATARQDAAAYQMCSHFAAAELWRAQACREQQLLLDRLLSLRPGDVAAQQAVKAAFAAKPGMRQAEMAERMQVALSAAAAPGIAPKALAPAPKALAAQRRGPGVPGGRGAASAEWPRQEAAAAKPHHRQMQTLSTSLQMLANEDPECLFIVRRINKLGFKASRKLKQHFAHFGAVERVLVAHSTVRQHGDPCCARRRPSSLGFVHMATAQAVKAILEHGAEHEVDGNPIRVQRFERQNTAQQGDEEDEEEEEEAEVDNFMLKMNADNWGRQHTASTTATMASFESNDSTFPDLP